MVDPKYNFAAMDKNGTVWFFQEKPSLCVFDAEIEIWRSANNNSYTQAEGPVLYINTEGVMWYSSLTARNPE